MSREYERDCDSNARRRLEVVVVFFRGGGEFETAYILALVRLVTVRALVLLWLLLNSKIWYPELSLLFD